MKLSEQSAKVLYKMLTKVVTAKALAAKYYPMLSCKIQLCNLAIWMGGQVDKQVDRQVNRQAGRYPVFAVFFSKKGDEAKVRNRQFPILLFRDTKQYTQYSHHGQLLIL